MTRDNIELSEQEQSQLPSVIEEFDLQWDIFRLLSNENNEMIDLIKGLKEDIRSTKTSNIGVFLSD